MIETENPEIDVDALMEEIRAEVMAARARGGARGDTPAAPSLTPASDLGWYGLRDQIQMAEQHSAVGLEVPPFGRYRGVKRRLARSVARVVFFVANVVTAPQRVYNASSIAALARLADRVLLLEQEVAALRARGAARDSAPGDGEAERSA